MSSSINLVEKKTEETDKGQLTQRLKKISLVSLFIVGVSSILMFLLSYRFSVGYVKQQEDNLIRKMTIYEQTSSRLFLLNTRLSDISFLLSSRKKYNSVTSSIIAIKPETLLITKYQIDDGGAVINASSSKLSDINDFINNLLALTSKKTITNVAIDGLNANPSGYEVKILAN